MQNALQTLLLVCTVALVACSARTVTRPLSAHETVRHYLDNGGQEKIRKSWNLPEGVVYDPLAHFSRDDIPASHGGPVARQLSSAPMSDVDMLRAMGQYIPGLDGDPVAAHDPQHGLRTAARQTAVRVAGRKSVYAVTYVGNPPLNARRAFQFALEIWADTFPCKVVLRVQMQWTVLAERTLAAANSPFTIVDRGSSRLRDETSYTPTMAAALSERDYTPGRPHIVIGFNRGQAWHTDPGTRAPNNLFDLATVALHEQCHSLFFSGALLRTPARRRAEFKSAGSFPSRFDYFITTSRGLGIARTCNPGELFSAITTPGLKFRTNVGSSSFRLYAPQVYQAGSSTYHFDAKAIVSDCRLFNISQAGCSDLMTFELNNGYTQHSIGEPTRRVMNTMLGQNSGVRQEGDCVIPPPTQDNSASSSGVLGFSDPVAPFSLPQWVIITVGTIGGLGALIVLYFVGTTLVKS